MLLYDLYIAYKEAKRHKSNTHSHVAFAYDIENNLIQLCDDIISENYKILPSIYFIQQNPIRREVFAWNFRDRIVHHLIYNYISPYREKQFIYDSYSCRKWKGTMFGINRLSKFMNSCSECYTKQARILKLDIQWYFMSINRDILWQKVSSPLFKRDKITRNSNSELFPNWKFLISWDFPDYLIKIIKDVIYNDPTKNWIFKWKRSDYNWLPHNKSLFYSPLNCGLPIWNLTSQLFSNIYLNDFDHYVKENLNIKYYGRYVDDFFLIHNDKQFLLDCIPTIRAYLSEKLNLTLHPNKIYLQPVEHWVAFLWAIIKPYRIYRSKRTISNFYKKMQSSNYIPKMETLNSYLWLMQHYKHYKIIQKILKRIKFEELDYIPEYAISFCKRWEEKFLISG